MVNNNIKTVETLISCIQNSSEELKKTSSDILTACSSAEDKWNDEKYTEFKEQSDKISQLIKDTAEALDNHAKQLNTLKKCMEDYLKVTFTKP